MTLTFYTNPMSRGQIARWMLEEVGEPYEQVLLDYATSMKAPDYLAINPMGKVPAIRHREVVVTEGAAICAYLADAFPEKRLAPPLGDALRGPYLRWMVFYGSCFEPAVVDRSMKREPAPRGSSPYGDFDTMLGTVTKQLAKGPWLLGETFTAADVLWGMGLSWTMGFKLVPELPELKAYTERFNARPAVARARAKDAELAAKMA